MGASGTVGGMDRRAVESAVSSLQSQVNACVDAGRKRVPYLAGDVAVQVLVSSAGRAQEVYLTSSTLGDSRVETCILKAYRAKQWPRPVGGDVGEVSQSFGFDADHRGDALKTVSADALAKAMGADDLAAMRSKLGQCGKEAGAEDWSVTFYVDPDGFLQSMGVASSNGKARAAVDCVHAIVSTTTFPGSDDGPMKVTLKMP